MNANSDRPFVFSPWFTVLAFSVPILGFAIMAGCLLYVDARGHRSSRAEYRAALQEYANAKIIHREENDRYERLSAIGSELRHESLERIKRNNKRLKIARERLERLTPDP